MKQGIKLLELAAEKAPSNPEINAHLTQARAMNSARNKPTP